MSDLSDIIIPFLEKYDIPYKENDANIIILCPYCLSEGKEKIKLYIDKYSGIFHCFRCETSGNPYKLIRVLLEFNNFFPIDITDIKLKLLDYLTSASVKEVEVIDENTIFEKIYTIREKFNSLVNSIRISNNFYKIPRMYSDYLMKRSIELTNDDVYYQYDNIPISYKDKQINVFPSLVFTSYFKSLLNFRSINSKKHPKNFRYFIYKIDNIPDYFTIDITRMKNNDVLDIYIFEGVFDALSFYNFIMIRYYEKYYTDLFKEYHRKIVEDFEIDCTIISLNGKTMYNNIFEFIKLKTIFENKGYKIIRFYFIFDNDVNLHKGLTSTIYYKSLEYRHLFEPRVYVMNTDYFIKKISHYCSHEAKDFNEFINQVKN